MKWVIVLSVFVLAAVFESGLAAIPEKMSYQGLLKTDVDTVVPDGNYDLTFRLYADSTAGPALWTETQTATVANGIFSVILGSDVPINLPFDMPYWLGVSIEANPELTPRSELMSSPYALRAKVADSIAGAVEREGTINYIPKFILGSSSESPDLGNSLMRQSGSTIEFGSSSEDGRIEVYEGGWDSPIVRIVEAHNGRGGSVIVNDAMGNMAAKMSVNNDDTGGALQVQRSRYHPGFAVDGNFNGLEEPRVDIRGSARSALFWMDQTGNSSVHLPEDAISAHETYDEPGVASDKVNGPAFEFTVFDSYWTAAAHVIDCPNNGFVLVIGTCQLTIQHSQGYRSFFEFGVSDSGYGHPPNQDVAIRIPATEPDGARAIPVTVHGLFQVGAGENVFWFLGVQLEGRTGSEVGDVQLTLVYFPTPYGEVSGTSTGLDDKEDFGGSDASVGNPDLPEPVASITTDRNRHELELVRRELAEMHARLEALESKTTKERE